MKKLSVILIVLVLVCHNGLISHLSKGSTTLTVTGKERIENSDGGYYLVFDGKQAFKNTDDVWQLKFDSSTLHSQLQVGKTYTCTKNFWRVPIFSLYENLVSCQEVK